MLPALESLGSSCPPSEGNTETGRQESRGLSKGSRLGMPAVSVTACEGSRPGSTALDGGQTHLPAPPSLGANRGRTDNMKQVQAAAPFPLGPASSRSYKRVSLNVLSRWPPSPPLPGTCSHPRLLPAWSLCLRALSPFLPRAALPGPQDPTHLLCLSPLPTSPSSPDLTSRSLTHYCPLPSLFQPPPPSPASQRPRATGT